MKKETWVVHAVAECRDCEWNAQGHKNAQAIAAKHAKHHGHLVVVEVGLHSKYDGRKGGG